MKKIFFLTFFLTFTITSPAFACSCVAEPTPSEVEFIGRPISIASFPVDYTKEIKFEVLEKRRGITDDVVVVATSLDGATCGYEFELGRLYLVFANRVGDQLETGLCYGNQRLYQAESGKGVSSDLIVPEAVAIEAIFEEE